MRVNSLLRQLVQATLSERRMQPIGAGHLVKRLGDEIEKLFREPVIWQYILDHNKTFIGNPDPEVWAELAENSMEYVHKDWKVGPKYVNGKIDLRLLGKHAKSVAVKIDALVRDIAKRYGWAVIAAKHSFDWNSELRYTLEGNYSKQKPRVNQTLYHTTPSWNVARILKKGLLPKKPSHEKQKHEWEEDEDEPDLKQGRQYSPRVYLTSSKQLANELVMAFQNDAVADAMSSGSGDFDPYTLLQIDVSKTLPGTKFYMDDEFEGSDNYRGMSFWTYSRIPTRAISIDPQDEAEYQTFLDETSKADDYGI